MWESFENNINKSSSKSFDSEFQRSIFNETKELKNNVINDHHKRTYEKLDFHLDISSIPEKWANIIKALRERYNNDNSLEGYLLNNPQIQNLLAQIVSQYANEWNYVASKQSKKENNTEDIDEDFDDKIESREDYVLRESTYEKFEEWLLSKEWIRTIINEIDNHIDEQWNLIENYPIDKKDLKLKLEKARIINLRFNYNISNNLFDNDEKKKLNDMWKVVQDGVNIAVKNYLTTWWVTFNNQTITSLNSAIFSGENGRFLEWLKENSKEKDEFEVLLREYIKNYAKLVLEKKNGEVVDVNLATWSNQLDLQLRSYLFIYGKIFTPDLFDIQRWNWYESNLTDLLKIILSDDYKELSEKIRDRNLLEKVRKAEELRKLRELQRRQEAAKRNREKNNRYSPDSKLDWKAPTPTQDSTNINDQTWTKIAERINLDDFKPNNNLSEITNSWLAKQKAFSIAWKQFSESNNYIKDIFTLKDIHNLYNTETRSVNVDVRNEFKNTDIMKWRSQEDVDNIYNILLSFSNEYENALKQIASKVNEQEWVIDEKIKNHALWSVIDNVRFLFSDIVKKWGWDSKFQWFKFNETEPVKRMGNEIIISGTFDWKDIKVRYDLVSWWLFMNSFLQHISPHKFVLWNNSQTDFKIWQLDSFDSILNQNYNTPDFSFTDSYQTLNSFNQSVKNRENVQDSDDKNPKIKNQITHFNSPFVRIPGTTASTMSHDKEEFISLKQKYSEMLNMNLGLIEDKIINNTRVQSKKNSIMINFMKTFNIIIDGKEDESIEFNDWSNLFDLLQILDNSGSVALERFQTFMEKISEYSWLNRWINNIFGSQKNQKSDITFNEKHKNKYISIIRDNANSFSESPWKFMWRLNFESDSQLWFAQMIIENITNDVIKPNWKLDVSKMSNFIRHLETDGKES